MIVQIRIPNTWRRGFISLLLNATSVKVKVLKAKKASLEQGLSKSVPESVLYREVVLTEDIET